MKIKAKLNLQGGGQTLTDTSTSTSIANKTVVSDLISDYDIQVQKYLNEKIDNDTLADYVVDQGTSGIWTWRKWNSGISECWGLYYTTYEGAVSQEGAGYYIVIGGTYPSNLFNETPLIFGSPMWNYLGHVNFSDLRGNTNTNFRAYLWSMAQLPSYDNIPINMYARGRWK